MLSRKRDTPVFIRVSLLSDWSLSCSLIVIGIGPKVTQSVLTAAFLFAFKDVLYEQTVKLRGTIAKRAVKA